MKILTQAEVEEAAKEVAKTIKHEYFSSMPRGRLGIQLYGVPRGGIPAVYLVARELECEFLVTVTDDPNMAQWIVDDIVDSGTTRKRYMDAYPKASFAALFTKTDTWLQFPWECSADGGNESATDIPLRLLQYVGEDSSREGLKETPHRFLKAWNHYTKGYEEDPAEILKAFEDGAQNVDEMVLVKDIPVYSTCEHHLATFFGVAHVSYIPNGRVVGLSKLVRLVECYARRLQVQERLTQQIANAIHGLLKPTGVGVILSCRHLCMEARGVRAPGTATITSCMLGAMREDRSARAELLELIR